MHGDIVPEESKTRTKNYGSTERNRSHSDTIEIPMHVCILTDFDLPSFVRVGELYQSTFEQLGWSVEHLKHEVQRADFKNKFDCIFHNVNGRNFRAISGCRNIAFFVHEWSHYPPAWVSYLDDFDALWTTTQHCKEIAERSGLKPPTHWIPPAIDFASYPTKTSYEAHTPFRFLYVGEWHFRKGLHLLFEAWEKAFPETGEAHLTIKTNPSCPFDPPRSDIEIIKEYWPREKLLQRYVDSDCYVSASLGEGWGLPILEAIACGLPVCANLWGGHGSMLNSNTCFAIPHQEVPQFYASKPELYASGQLCGYSGAPEVTNAIKHIVRSEIDHRKFISLRSRSESLKCFGTEALLRVQSV